MSRHQARRAARAAARPGRATASERREQITALMTGQPSRSGTALEPVEFVGMAEPVVAPESLAGRLRADPAGPPSRDRPELDQLRQWCTGPDWTGIRLATGPGGQGKTRLARHLVTELAAQGVGEPDARREDRHRPLYRFRESPGHRRPPRIDGRRSILAPGDPATACSREDLPST